MSGNVPLNQAGVSRGGSWRPEVGKEGTERLRDQRTMGSALRFGQAERGD